MLFQLLKGMIQVFFLKPQFLNLIIEIVGIFFQISLSFNYIVVSFLLITLNHFLMAYYCMLLIFLFQFFIILI